jgi:hypothetical protein
MVNINPGAGGDGWETAWCGHPCRFQLTGWLQAARAVAAVMYGSQPPPDLGGRLQTVNYCGAQRVDMLATVDGIFTEDWIASDHYPLLASVGLSTTGEPGPGVG